MCRGARPGGFRPPAPPSPLRRPQVIGGRPVAGAGGPVDASRAMAGGAARDDHAEVLRVDGARLAVGEGGRRVGAHADGGVSVVGVEDVGEVLGRVHPGFHDRRGRRQTERAPGDVLAHFEADVAAVHVAAGPQPVKRRVAARPHVVEVVPESHVLGMALRSRFDARVLAQGRLAVAFADLVHEALHGRADAAEVARAGHQRRVRAGTRTCRRARGRRQGGGNRAGEHRQSSRQRRADSCHTSCIGSPAVDMSHLDICWACAPPVGGHAWRGLARACRRRKASPAERLRPVSCSAHLETRLEAP